MPSSKETQIMIKQEGAETQTVNKNACNIVIKNSAIIIAKLVVVSFLPGWFILFNIFRANLDIIPAKVRLFMKILLAVETGATFLCVSTLIMLINKTIYNILTYFSYKNNTSCGQKIVALFCICITNVSVAYAGYSMLFDFLQIRIETVEPKYKNIVYIVTSLQAGWVMHIIGSLIGIRFCFSKEHRQIIYKKFYQKCFNIEQDDTELVMAEIVDKKNKKEEKNKMDTNIESTDKIKELHDMP